MPFLFRCQSLSTLVPRELESNTRNMYASVRFGEADDQKPFSIPHQAPQTTKGNGGHEISKCALTATQDRPSFARERSVPRLYPPRALEISKKGAREKAVCRNFNSTPIIANFSQRQPPPWVREAFLQSASVCE